MLVHGTGTSPTDFQNLQSAINSQDPVITLQGNFNLGGAGNSSQRQTVVINRPVVIEGRGGTHPRITGGGALLPSSSVLAEVHSGAFKVDSQSASAHVSIQGLDFSGWRGSAIFADACLGGLDVVGCRFYDPVPGTSSGFLNGALDFASAIFAAGNLCRGRLLVQNNTCDFTRPMYVPTLAEVKDEQFLACLETDFNSVRVQANVIATRDDGIEVILGGYLSSPPADPFPCATLIEGNTVTIKRAVDDTWPGHGAIICCNNRSGTTEIAANIIQAYGKDVVGLCLSGSNFNVRGNTLTIGQLDGAPAYAAMMLGADMTLSPLPNLGPSLSYSDFHDNTVSGSALFALATFDPNLSNQSSGNVVEENHFQGFTPPSSGATIFLSQNAKHNRFIGNSSATTLGPGWAPLNDNLFMPA